MCCRDLCPFNIVERSGFKQFLLQRGVIKNEDQLPCRQTLSRGALYDVYDSLLQNINKLIQKSLKTIGMTMDTWTDNYRRRSYIIFMLHFCTDDFKQHDLTLCTALFESTHTGEQIKREMGERTRLFGLESKLVVYITDQRANVVKESKIAAVDRYGCVAHGLHNLITVDGISKTTELSELIDRAKDITKSFTYKGVMLENEAKDIAYEAFLNDMENMTQMIEDDNIRLNYDDQDET